MKLSKIIGWVIVVLWFIGLSTVIAVQNGLSLLTMALALGAAIVIVAILCLGVWLITKD